MYFWIVGDNSTIISAWLAYLHPTDIAHPRKNIVTFNTQYPERLATCAALIKRWTIVSNKELSDLENIKSAIGVEKLSTIGVETKELGSHLKKQISSIKRFKLIELIHTDLEIKDHGTEIINIDNTDYGIVTWYQNIALYEAIDFWKPVGGMNIGMMPSKLALTLVNIGIGEYEEVLSYKSWVISWKKELNTSNLTLLTPTIWDPFCGFGTTNFLVNALGYNTIASDINVTSMKQNSKRRSNSPLSKGVRGINPNEKLLKSLILKQDVTEEFKSPLFRHANIIVSEWWLGHIVTSRTAPFETNVYAQEVKTLYTAFAKNLTILATSYKSQATNDESSWSLQPTAWSKILTIVITIPVWLKYDISVSQDIMNEFVALWRTARLITQPYSREKQLVGRQILIASFWS